ncbi:MAG: UvrD-helicase domain-containing protein, partial [bacterium]|nr:UvrD-helicase domain-containing protein [bacterium]
MKSLQIENMPLNGRSLIEASAGTGKTYTISNIILRLILVPQQGLKGRPLKIEEILVVTFTKAATQELKDRIREKITSAQHYVEGGEEKDPTLIAIVDQAVAEEDRETIYLRCREAALYLDDAPIFTIHGFCQRMLAEYSFGAAQPYQQVLVENNGDILQQLSQELWRENFYSSESSKTQMMLSCFSSPEDIQ